MAVVLDSDLGSEVPATTSFGGYGKPEREGHSEVLHHHFYYPSGYLHGLGNLAEVFKHKKHANGDIVSWTPDSDVRETKLAYHIEMELAGVSDKKNILIQWMSPRTLLVESKAVRPDLTRGREADGDALWESDVMLGSETNGVEEKAVDKSMNDQDGGPCVRCPDTENEMTTKLLHVERNIGSWRRCFTLPIDCDMKTLRAGLEAGLLHISVFKREMAGEELVTRTDVE